MQFVSYDNLHRGRCLNWKISDYKLEALLLELTALVLMVK
jgi:hypothetical protein